VKYLRSVVGAGTALVGAAALRYALFWLVLDVTFLAILAMVIIAAAAFSKRNAPMTRLRALTRDLRGEGNPPSRRRLHVADECGHLQGDVKDERVLHGADPSAADIGHSNPLGAGRRGRRA